MSDQKITVWKRIRAFSRHNGRILIGGVLIAFVLFMTIGAPLFTSFDPLETNGYERYLASGVNSHPLGTDAQGRDIFSRLLYGGRASIIIAVGVQFLTIVAGSLVGLICGYFPKVDIVIMRILEAVASLPTILLVYVLVMVLGRGYVSLISAMVIGGISGVTRFVRAQVLSLRKKEFIEREITIGAGTFRTMLLHVLPHCSSYLLVRFGSGLGGSIISLATLSYLGVGLPGGAPTWGADIGAAQGMFLVYPDKVFYPMIAIGIAVFGFSMLGDGFRDYLSPDLR